MNIRVFTGFVVMWLATASMIFTGFVIIDTLNGADMSIGRIVAIANVSLNAAVLYVFAYLSGVGNK